MLELLVLTPLLLVLLLGLIDVADAFNTYVGLVNASREGARLAARGNVYQAGDLLAVVQQHTPGLELAARGAGAVTTVDCVAGRNPQCACTSRDLWGTGAAQITCADVQARRSAYVGGADASYLGSEKLIVVELDYQHPAIVGFLWQTLPMHVYTIMPVSAPS